MSDKRILFFMYKRNPIIAFWLKTLLEERGYKVLFGVKGKGEEIEVVPFMRKENSFLSVIIY